MSAIDLEIGKNNGVVDLITAAEVEAFFSVSDTREACAIYHYRIYLTTSEELTSTNDADLYATL